MVIYKTKSLDVTNSSLVGYNIILYFFLSFHITFTLVLAEILIKLTFKLKKTSSVIHVHALIRP